MATIQAKEKLDYYPTPECIVDALANALSLPYNGAIHALDPCAGTGAALSRLIERLFERHRARWPYARTLPSVETYGIEPERLRAKAATTCLSQVLQTSFFSTTLSTGDGADVGWQLAFVNPPYDTDTEHSLESGKKVRLELTFLQRTTFRLCPGGILVYIIPQQRLAAVAEHLASCYDQLACLRFPDDAYQPDPKKQETISLYAQFQQVVVLAQRRPFSVPADPSTLAMIEMWATGGPRLHALPVHEHSEIRPRYDIPQGKARTKLRFSTGTYAPERTANALYESLGAQEQASPRREGATSSTSKTGVWASMDYLAARCPDPKTIGLGIGTPLAPLKNAHLAVLSVAGIANRAILTGRDGRRVIVKGSSRKVPVSRQYETEDETVEKITDTFETALWCIDLETGTFIRVETGKSSPLPFQVEYETLSLAAFLDNFGASLSEQVAQANPPRYEGEHQVPWLSEGLTHLKRRPIGKQREVIAATVHSLVNMQPGGMPLDTLLERSAMVAEMSTGKTFLALSATYLADLYACGATQVALPETKLQHFFPMVVLCPPIMARKWQREAEQTIPGIKAVIIKRMSTPSLKNVLKKSQQDDDEEEIDATDDLAQFRRFDPSFQGSSLSALACLDRTAVRIQRELEHWQQRYDQALKEGQTPPNKPCHMIILTASVAKRGMEWMPVYRLKAARYFDRQSRTVKLRRDGEGKPFSIPCCPSCFHVIQDERRIARLKRTSAEYRHFFGHIEMLREQGRLAPYEEETLLPLDVLLTEKELQGSKDHRVKRFCMHCGEPLWQDVPTVPKGWKPFSPLQARQEDLRPLPLPRAGTLPTCVTSTFRRPYPLGKYLQKRYKHVFHMLLADEVHEGSDGTALDFARQKLANACKHMLGLTGTLSNGYAGSLFRLYYTMNRSVRQTFGYHEQERWIDLYGKRQITQKTYKEKEVGHGSSSERRIGKPIIREIAGFAPQGLAHILPSSTFLELADVAPALPPYREYIHVVEMDPQVAQAYARFEAETTRELGKMLAVGDTSGLAAWWNSLLNYPNMPYRGWTCTVKRSGQVLGRAPALAEAMLYAKERELIRFVQTEMQAGQRVLIFSENTGTLDVMPRLKKLLAQKVRGRLGKPLNVSILRSTTVETINREAWLAKQVDAECDVLICNPKLVKVGLDLLAFPTLIYVSIPKGTSDLRQSTRRSHRLGQTQPVKVIFLIYPTMEFDLLELMAKKMKMSLMVEGKLPGEGLVSFGEEDDDNESDVVVQLARQVLANLEAEHPTRTVEAIRDLQDLFKENTQIEREQNQILGQEAAIEPVEFEPVREETLPPTEPLALDDDVTLHGIEVVTQADKVLGEEPHPEQATKPQKVTIIQTSITSGKDPWAVLRSQYLKPKKRRKHVVVEGIVDLWSILGSEPELPAVEVAPHAPEASRPNFSQPELW
ncbi:DUF6094 domain-containing protein [Ktedonospora formicarum]|uniref:Helicase C-terminal domain-containing protein n=1 Tax=Ktedonospora formicarum TaxID=2778364 RepID=A0A8J3I991_9CHLR|nr:DUF6094 domain-containing protein [Ktedonospora formicarum]GHO49170.1 hypothetical protein KSX_73330 [Ktedonospora formicarum]